MKIKVVTDSTSDLPHDLADKLGITIVPLNVHFGTEVYRDGVDIAADVFYQRLQERSVLPSTSQPSVGAFLEVYKRLSKDADAILSVHVSSLMSGTHNSAVQAKDELKAKCQIEVIDTGQASMGLGLIVKAVAESVNAGAGLAEAKEVAAKAAADVVFFGLVETLEYLQKGGRIGKAQAFLGTLLNVKPLLIIKDGVTHPLERYRTRPKASDRLCEVAEGFAPLEALSVLHSTTPDDAKDIAQRLSQLAPKEKIVMSRVGPVVGTYLGPGALGIAVRRKGK